MRGRRVVVVGGGRSGVAAAELLVARGADVTLTDLKAHLPEDQRLRAAGVTLVLGRHPLDLILAADLVVVSPGVPWQQPVLEAGRQAGVKIIGEVELAWRFVRGRVVAVTGTKGKSTTTTLVGRMLAAGGVPVTAGGNLGTALSAQVAQSTPGTVHVVEVSSFQLEAIETFRPWIAVLLNVSADHLDRHVSFDEYVAAKGRVFANQEESDWAVVNADDPPALELAARTRARRRMFAMDTAISEGVTISGGYIVDRTEAGETPLIPLGAIRLLGRHLVSDVLAAAAAARLAGVSPEAMTAAVEGFTGLEHTLEPVAEIAGVRFVNDTKATNIEAARRSIESFEGGVVPIIGGRFKGGDFRDLRAAVARRVTAVVAIGESRGLVREALGDVVPVTDALSMADAIRAAFAAAAPGGTVVLAPACSSFDMFTDYAERGRVFKEEVARLAAERRAGREP
ncbi:MAG: UDP-N-acetylmuramoyl-L-alanine--D-glutamate ligase [Acidobacteria bacterium]|nr:UDP-N-acetylmuramoyl-L-alanine--D-glutamate ligase [Acidobacteriota bacterium]